ncbi:hypothetical protein [Streptomyces sp. NPDC102282]
MALTLHHDAGKELVGGRAASTQAGAGAEWCPGSAAPRAAR